MDLIFITLGRAAQFLVALVTLRVATTLLSPEEMGKIALVVTTTAFFALLLINPVGMFINRRLHAWQESGTARFYLFHYAVYIATVASVAAVSLLIIGMSELFEFDITAAWLMTLVCCSLIFNTINQTAIPSLNLLGNSRRFILLTVLTQLASLMAATLMVWIFERSAQFWLIGLILGQGFFALVGVRDLFTQLATRSEKKTIPDTSQQHLSRLFSFSWPVAIAAGLGWVQMQGYRYIMVEELGLAEVGLFVAGYVLSAGIMAGFESILTTYFQPRLYRDSNTKDIDKRIQAWRYYAAAVIPSLILTMAIIVATAPELTILFLGASFHSTSQFVVWGALAEAGRVLASVYALIAHVQMRTLSLIIPNIAGAALSLMLCQILIPHIGAIGVGVALSVSGLVMVLLLHLTLIGMLGVGRSLQPLAAPLAGGALLLMCGYGMRYMLGQQEWYAVITNLIVTGILFLALQFYFLRRYFANSNMIGTGK